MKGHQDDDPDTILDQWALLNIQMDNLAKSYWHKQVNSAPQTIQALTGEYWPIFVNGRKVHSALCTTIYEDIYQKS